jgi:hypothetical protein
MTDAPGRPDSKPRAMPRWVKVFAIVAIVVVVLVIAVMLLTGGQHGPSRHIPGGDAPGQSPTSTVPGGHTPPEGVHG